MHKKSGYYFEKNNFVIENYDQKNTFSNFLAGVCGEKGMPLWSFYVNRGQCIAGFGYRDKNAPIMQFAPFFLACQRVAVNGFRTFLKADGKFYEAFAPNFPQNKKIKRTMKYDNSVLTIIERNTEISLETEVTYFCIPNEDYAALCRKVTIRNLSADDRKIELCDGLAELMPYGTMTDQYDSIGNTVRTFMNVYELETKFPKFAMSASTGASSEVSKQLNRHYAVAIDESGKKLQPVVDFISVFGQDTSKQNPVRFIEGGTSALIDNEQAVINEVPSAFFINKFTLKNEYSQCALYGSSDSMAKTEKKINSVFSFDYIAQKEKEARDVVDKILADIKCETAFDLFDKFIAQSYFDNVLRGGTAVLLDDGKSGKPYYIYSRIHGDLERDYNRFILAPEFYSCGNGNFRDILQNRRSEVLMNPFVGDFNIKQFFDYIMFDGTNPIRIVPPSFKYTSYAGKLAQEIALSGADKLTAFLENDFSVGRFYKLALCGDIKLKATPEKALALILKDCEIISNAFFGEGCYTDHFVYLVDLLENFNQVFPEKIESLLFGRSDYKYFYAPVYILPRKEKQQYVSGKIRRYGAINEDQIKEIEKLSGVSAVKTAFAKDKNGKIVTNNLAGKIIGLILMKLLSLDPIQTGLDMDADKPGWNDGMFGLPALFGSNVADSMELLRLIDFYIAALNKCKNGKIEIFAAQEILYNAFKNLTDGGACGMEYYEKANDAKEEFRKLVVFKPIENKKVEIDKKEVCALLLKAQKMLVKNIEKSRKLDKDGIYPAFLEFIPEKYEFIKDAKGNSVLGHYKNFPLVDIKSFTVRVLPAFSESAAKCFKYPGFAHKDMYDKVKKTELYDKKYKIYKTCVSLENESYEIGSIRNNTKGYFERESAFIHNTYKYIYGLLKAGLYNEFFEEIKTNLTAFMDPAVYGRNPVENSSFVCTSNHPNKNNEGRGFQPRLTGANAEVISIWQSMFLGEEPFSFDKELAFNLRPVLSKEFFKGGKVKTTLFKKELEYRNPDNKDCFGTAPKNIKVYLGGKIIFDGDKIKGKFAEQIREGKFDRIVATL